jgi:hypothetical protein
VSALSDYKSRVGVTSRQALSVGWRAIIFRCEILLALVIRLPLADQADIRPGTADPPANLVREHPRK